MERNNQDQDIYGVKNSRFSPEERARMSQDNEVYRTVRKNTESQKKTVKNTRATKNTGAEKTAVSRNERIKNSTKTRKRQKKIQNNLIIAMLMIVAVALIGAFASFAMQISEIEVTGSERYSAKSVLTVAKLEPGDSMLLISSGYLENKIESLLPYVEDAEISREWPDKVIISITDAVPTLAIDTGNGYVLMNNSCKVLDDDAMVAGDAAIVKGIGIVKAVPGEAAEFSDNVSRESFVNLCKAFEEYGIENISEYDVTSVSSISVIIDHRIEVNLGTLAGAADKLAFCKAVIEKTIEADTKNPMVIDFTADGKAYARRKDDNNVSFNAPEEEATTDIATEENTVFVG